MTSGKQEKKEHAQKKGGEAKKTVSGSATEVIRKEKSANRRKDVQLRATKELC